MKPMLAQNWDKHRAKINYPCVVQPKLDGIRCLAHREGDTITYWSRAEKPLLNLSHLDPWCLTWMSDGEWLDGELYNHTIGFQKICSLVKRKQPDTEKIRYWVYDVIVPDTDFANRVPHLNGYLCLTEADVDKQHKFLVSQGYEGSIIRNLTGYYKHGRSFDLQKRKDWFDEEYPIVGVVEGKGKFVGCAIFILDCPGGRFSCTAPGTVGDKQYYFENKELYIGRELTVKYQEKTESGIPRFPIAIGVRDYE